MAAERIPDADQVKAILTRTKQPGFGAEPLKKSLQQGKLKWSVLSLCYYVSVGGRSDAIVPRKTCRAGCYLMAWRLAFKE